MGDDELIVEAQKKYKGLVPLVYDIETMALDEARPEDMEYAVYLKREADKVIAELIKKNERLANKDIIMASETIKEMFHEIYRHKYKRCWALAQEWRNYAAFCGMQSSCHNHRGFGKTAGKWTWKECHAWRCRKRWLALAEKFKEA